MGPGHDPGVEERRSVCCCTVYSVYSRYSVQCSGGWQQQWTSVSPSWGSRPGGDGEGGDYSDYSALHSEGVRVTRVTTPCTLHINTGVGGKQRRCARLHRPAPPADAMQQCSVTMLRSGGRRGELQSMQHYTAGLHCAA